MKTKANQKQKFTILTDSDMLLEEGFKMKFMKGFRKNLVKQKMKFKNNYNKEK
jgi:hypothetical protein